MIRARGLAGLELCVLCVLCALATTAHADDPDTAPPPRPVHGSASAGGALLVTGDGGDHQRAELELDVEPASRYGALVAWRGFDRSHHGLVTAGLVFEAGAARPLLVIDLHADAGADLDLHAPVIGGGVRTVLGLVGPLGIALDSGAYLVIDGVETTRLQLSLGAALVARW